jgi:hypothetical protein
MKAGGSAFATLASLAAVGMYTHRDGFPPSLTAGQAL